MPYISKENREKFSNIIDELLEMVSIKDPGELNFLLTIVCLSYLAGKEEKYQLYNDIIGALECCKQELYRRKISSYENTKIKSNGDVY